MSSSLATRTTWADAVSCGNRLGPGRRRPGSREIVDEIQVEAAAASGSGSAEGVRDTGCDAQLSQPHAGSAIVVHES